jgi:hypothetical protein
MAHTRHVVGYQLQSRKGAGQAHMLGREHNVKAGRFCPSGLGKDRGP